MPILSELNESYDVAVSFLRQDEPLALEIYSSLVESLTVFVYSKKQEELAGTDGLESFREIFRHKSRMVVVLYREGWGQSPWTRIEEAAIKDRFFEEGWDWLLFVMLDDASRPPKWLPETEIRLSYTKYGPVQLLGAIKLRAQKVGAEIRTESALDRALRLEEASRVRTERDQLLMTNGVAAAQSEFNQLGEHLKETVELIGNKLTTVRLEGNFVNGEYTLRTEHVSVNAFFRPAYPVTNTRIVVMEFKGALIFRQEPRMYTRKPVMLSE